MVRTRGVAALRDLVAVLKGIGLDAKADSGERREEEKIDDGGGIAGGRKKEQNEEKDEEEGEEELVAADKSQREPLVAGDIGYIADTRSFVYIVNALLLVR